MGTVTKYIGSQFGNPRGIIGKICCFVMNHKMYRKTGAKIDGIDISNDMKIAATNRNADGINNGDIQLTVGDCCNLQYKDQSFNTVTTVNTIYFWNDTIQGLKEILRVLKEDGVFYNAVYSKEWMTKTSYTKEGFKIYEKDEYLQMAKQAGFFEVTIKDIVAGRNYLVICRK